MSGAAPGEARGTGRAETIEIDLDDTPVVTIDLDIMERNIRRMQALCDECGVALRPHVKTHKIPEIAKVQLAAGARGITCQKLGEVEVMADAGIDDILLTYNLLGEAKLRRLREVAGRIRLSVVCDNAVCARQLSAAVAGADTLAASSRDGALGVLVECDAGAGRNGVPSPAEAAALAGLIHHLPGLRFAGLMFYPITERTGEFARAALDEVKRAGLVCDVISTGGTPSSVRLRSVPGVTEHRAGAYVFNDRSHVEAGWCTWEECAMRIRTTVVSRPSPGRAILDAGSKTLSSDLLGLRGYGYVVEYPGAVIAGLSEEHGILDLSACRRKPEVGEVVTVIPNHACVVTNLHDSLVGVRRGRVETVWRVQARGRVR